MGMGSGVGLEGGLGLPPEMDQRGSQQQQPNQNDVYGNSNQNSTPTLQACVENISLWLQVRPIHAFAMWQDYK